VSQATVVHFVHASFQQKKLIFVNLSGTEELGRPYCYVTEFCCEDDESLAPDDFLGQTMSVEVISKDEDSRFFHGVIRSFRQEGRYSQYRKYRVELVPELWLLTQKSDCRIFQNKTVIEIINEVMSSNNPKNESSATYPTVPFCAQYRESDFDFVSRLMEAEGIFYYFVSHETRHEMHLIDSNLDAAELQNGPDLKFRGTGKAADIDHISSWRHDHRIRSGMIELKDYDFEKPDVPLETKSQIKLEYNHSDLSVFDYPGKYVESQRGETLAKVRLNEILTEHEHVEALSNCQALSAGTWFNFLDHPIDSENGEYLIIKTTINVQSSELEPFGRAENIFETQMRAVPKNQPFKPKRSTPKPYVRGPQTAVVVGKKGEEIWTDKHGRVKVQFHWDRQGKKDENSSCWIRVSQAWAGKNWGAIQLPRIGQEVIVEFLEGDPDQPIITGRVYNENMPVPYKLPENQTQSGVVSRSTKTGDTSTFNELRFEDKKDSEEIYFHAEKDFHRVVENSDTLDVGLEKKDPGDQTITIHNNRTVTINEGDDLLNVNKGGRTVTVSKGDHTTKVDAGKVLIKAATEITLQVGSSKITVKPDSITISAPTVTIEGKMKAEVKGLNTDVSGGAMVKVSGPLVKIN
jgi:type VI secretion system secreted protein VgrG